MRIALMGSSVGLENVQRLDGETIDRLHGGNTGNLAFVNAIDLHLQRRATVVPWGAPAEMLRGKFDLLVIACANQLGPHVDLGKFADILAAAGIPVIALGLGAQADSQEKEAVIPEGTARWLKVVSDLSPSGAPNIGLRGSYTHAQLDRLGLAHKAVVIGCPSNLTTLDSDFVSEIVEKAKRTPRRIASAAGQPHWPKLAPLERSILDLVDATDGSCVIQHNRLMIHLGLAEFAKISEKDFRFLKDYFRPGLDDDEFAIWCRRNMLCFGNAPSWMKWLRRHDFVTGPRFHGIMLAIQAGVPAGCFAFDSRTMEMCQTMCIPVVDAFKVALPLKLEDLHTLFPFDSGAYADRRAELARHYLSILDSAGIESHPGLRRVAGHASGATA